MAKTSYSVGFDLGGTKLASALVDSEGELLEYRKVPLYYKGRPEKASQQQSSVIQSMVESAQYFQNAHPKAFKSLKGFGLASAGPLDVEKGELVYPHNFDGWKKFAIRDELAKALGEKGFKGPVHFQNDAMAASLGEGWVGGARNASSFVVITIGTGVGSGLILNGHPVQTKGMGSEWGHTLINISGLSSPKDLHKHTVEGIASGTGILRRAKEKGFKGNSTEELVAALKSGETKWKVLFDDSARAIATLAYILSIGCNLDRILISGGLIKEKDLFMPVLKEYYLELIKEMNIAFKAPIQVAKLKDKAGVFGAARLPFMF